MCFFSIFFIYCNKEETIDAEITKIGTTAVEDVEEKPFTSTHIFKAKLKEVKYYLCGAYTALCPDRCGASGDYAYFDILEYNLHVVNGQSGTETLSVFQRQLSDFHKKDFDNDYVRFIRNLTIGDIVTIRVDYVYDISEETGVRIEIEIVGIEK